jgi:hypothetical protein
MGVLVALGILLLCARMAGGFFKLLLSMIIFLTLIFIWPAALAVYLFIIIPLAIVFMIFE